MLLLLPAKLNEKLEKFPRGFRKVPWLLYTGEGKLSDNTDVLFFYPLYQGIPLFPDGVAVQEYVIYPSVRCFAPPRRTVYTIVGMEKEGVYAFISGKVEKDIKEKIAERLKEVKAEPVTRVLGDLLVVPIPAIYRDKLTFEFLLRKLEEEVGQTVQSLIVEVALTRGEPIDFWLRAETGENTFRVGEVVLYLHSVKSVMERHFFFVETILRLFPEGSVVLLDGRNWRKRYVPKLKKVSVFVPFYDVEKGFSLKRKVHLIDVEENLEEMENEIRRGLEEYRREVGKGDGAYSIAVVDGKNRAFVTSKCPKEVKQHRFVPKWITSYIFELSWRTCFVSYVQVDPKGRHKDVSSILRGIPLKRVGLENFRDMAIRELEKVLSGEGVAFTEYERFGFEPVT